MTDKPELTREQVECWRKDLLRAFDDDDNRRELNALCNLALRALSGGVAVPLWFLKFLDGSGPHENGLWFGEDKPGEKGAFWWRKDLTAMLAAAPASPEGRGDAVNVAPVVYWPCEKHIGVSWAGVAISATFPIKTVCPVCQPRISSPTARSGRDCICEPYEHRPTCPLFAPAVAKEGA